MLVIGGQRSAHRAAVRVVRRYRDSTITQTYVLLANSPRLDVETTLLPDKTLTRVSARHVASGAGVEGYEIHLGRTDGPDCSRPFAMIGNAADGAISASGRVIGTYLHGCFSSDGFRAAYLASLGAAAGPLSYDALIERTLDELAEHLARHVDLDKLLALAEPV